MYYSPMYIKKVIFYLSKRLPLFLYWTVFVPLSVCALWILWWSDTAWCPVISSDPSKKVWLIFPISKISDGHFPKKHNIFLTGSVWWPKNLPNINSLTQDSLLYWQHYLPAALNLLRDYRGQRCYQRPC